jgi:hypothetical protein
MGTLRRTYKTLQEDQSIFQHFIRAIDSVEKTWEKATGVEKVGGQGLQYQLRPTKLVQHFQRQSRIPSPIGCKISKAGGQNFAIGLENSSSDIIAKKAWLTISLWGKS